MKVVSSSYDNMPSVFAFFGKKPNASNDKTLCLLHVLVFVAMMFFSND